MEYATTIVYLSIKNKPVICEYFIWSIDSIISMIDSSFHNPKNYEQLMIILFKDIISFKMLPAFFILMSHKNEILYDLIFKSIIRIVTQYNEFNIKLKTITSDSEIGLIKAIENNFPNINRINCFFIINVI